MTLNLPSDFTRTIRSTFGEAGRQFLDELPALIDEAVRRWNLTGVQPVSNLSYNFVAYALSSTTSPTDQPRSVVLKIGVPDRELTSEMAALRSFDGRGAVRLIDADAARGMILMERVKPGDLLADLPDDDQATHIAAQVMLKLWRPAPKNQDFIQLSDWFEGFKKLRRHFNGTTGPLDKTLVERAESAVKDFFTEKYTPMLIHGDLHHFNILSSERGWLAIDPKGVIGPAGYEVGPLLINPWCVKGLSPNLSQITERRIAILSEHLGIERRRILDWGIAHAVLSAWWGITDNTGWESSIACAGIFSRIQV